MAPAGLHQPHILRVAGEGARRQVARRRHRQAGAAGALHHGDDLRAEGRRAGAGPQAGAHQSGARAGAAAGAGAGVGQRGRCLAAGVVVTTTGFLSGWGFLLILPSAWDPADPPFRLRAAAAHLVGVEAFKGQPPGQQLPEHLPAAGQENTAVGCWPGGRRPAAGSCRRARRRSPVQALHAHAARASGRTLGLTVPNAHTSAGSWPGMPSSTSGASQRGLVCTTVNEVAPSSRVRLRLKSATWRGGEGARRRGTG